MPARGAGAWMKLLPVLVAAATFVTFLPALNNEFVNWDDDKLLLENYAWRGLGGPQLVWMFTQGMQGHYHPLTWVSFAIDYVLWGGLDARGFHLTNMVWHALNAALFYLLALRLLRLTMPASGGGKDVAIICGAAFAALVFGVHPLRVESVAWVTERRDVLSTFFLLACLLCYLRYTARPPAATKGTKATRQQGNQARRRGSEPLSTRSESTRREQEAAVCSTGDTGSSARWYIASVALLAASLLSKAWGITLPVVLLVLDFYPLRRLRWEAGYLISKPARKAYLDKIPFALLAGWTAYWAAKVQAGLTIMKPLSEYGWAERVAQAAYGLVFYPLKTLVPVDLSPIYEIPVDMDPFAAGFVMAGVVVVLITVGLIALGRRWPGGLVLWVCYGVIVSPVLGIAQSGPQLVADRYSYVSCLTWALLVGAALTWCLSRRTSGSAARRIGNTVARAGVIVAIAGVAVLVGMTWRQTQVWRTSRTLWEHTLAVRPDSWNAHVNLGVLCRSEGKSDEAVRHLSAALEIKPDMTEAHANIAPILADQGREAEALEHVRRVRELSPGPSLFLVNVGTTLARLGRLEEATEAYREALQAWPDDPMIHLNLGAVLERQGDVAGAIGHFIRVVEPIEALGVVNEATAGTTQYGRVYVQACVRLRALFHQQGDRERAREFGQKLRALGLGRPR